MIEKLLPIKLPPGFYHNGTDYDAKGRWHDGNLVRFHEGSLRPIGAWRRAKATNGSGSDMAVVAGSVTAQRLLAWPSTEGDRVVIACGDGVFAYDPGAATTSLTTITPAGFSSTAGWHLDTFGGLLLACDGEKVYEWDGDLTADLTEITNDPTDALGGVVATPERFMVVLGAQSDPRLVQWADRESTSVFTPSPTNEAGDFPLTTVGEIVCGRRGKGQTLIFTSTDMWSMTFVGGSAIYSFRQEGDNCGIIAPGAAVVVDGRAFWMGRNGFFVYDGFVRPLSCDVSDKVFGALDLTGAASAPQCFTMSAFNEVWWLYSASGLMRYVIYNYKDNHWVFGDFDEGNDNDRRRLAGIDSGILARPLMIDQAHRLMEHEIGSDYDDAQISATTGPIDLGNGDQIMRIQKIVADANSGTQFNVGTAMNPSDGGYAAATFNGAGTGTEVDCRITARQIWVKVVTLTGPLGIIKLGVIPGGRR